MAPRKKAAPATEEKPEETPAEAEATNPRDKLDRPAVDAPLALKLAWVINDIGDRKAAGSNTHFSYKYFTDKQLSGLFQQRLTGLGVIMIPRVLEVEVRSGQTKKGDPTYLTNMPVEFTFVDGYTGQTLSGVGYGQGDDPGDKGANKAFTGATKYFLLKLGLIGGEADSEADEQTDERHTAPQRQERTNVGPSNVQGVQRGGRQATPSEAQILKIRKLAQELNINAVGVGRVVKNTLDIDVELPDDAAKAGPPLIKFLESLKPEDLGKLIATLEEAKSRSAQVDADFDKAEAILAEGMEADAAQAAAEAPQEAPPE